MLSTDNRSRSVTALHFSVLPCDFSDTRDRILFDGVPLLRAGFNSLVDLEKISGGSAESFLKNSARAVTINFDANASPQVMTTNPDGTPSGKTVRDVIGEQVDSLNRNIDSALVTQGATAGTLQTQISDPSDAFDVAAKLFAASVRIPYTILFGQQTGRLASDEDKADMVARCESRQENLLTPMIEELVTRLQAAGIVEAGRVDLAASCTGIVKPKSRLSLGDALGFVGRTLLLLRLNQIELLADAGSQYHFKVVGRLVHDLPQVGEQELEAACLGVEHGEVRADSPGLRIGSDLGVGQRDVERFLHAGECSLALDGAGKVCHHRLQAHRCDLGVQRGDMGVQGLARSGDGFFLHLQLAPLDILLARQPRRARQLAQVADKIGRASCRERVSSPV